jgi:hypothetical protein
MRSGILQRWLKLISSTALMNKAHHQRVKDQVAIRPGENKKEKKRQRAKAKGKERK